MVSRACSVRQESTRTSLEAVRVCRALLTQVPLQVPSACLRYMITVPCPHVCTTSMLVHIYQATIRNTDPKNLQEVEISKTVSAMRATRGLVVDHVRLQITIVQSKSVLNIRHAL